MSQFSREDHEFHSQRTRCAGWLYLPEGVAQPPVIIMGHGLAAQRDFALPKFAERFAAEGWAVFLFDYRCFGDSDGEPRQWVSHKRHAQDWDAAISHVKALPNIDAQRIALWGSSYGGGHVLSAAARRHDVRAAIAQVPFVDGLSSALQMNPLTSIQGSLAALFDITRWLFGGKPYYMPVVGRPGEFAVMNSAESYDGYMAIVPQDSKWQNRIPARLFLSILFNSPMRSAGKISCPTLLVAGRDDSLIPIKAVEKTASRIPEAELVTLDCNHFAPYDGEAFEQNIGAQISFLRKQLNT